MIISEKHFTNGKSIRLEHKVSTAGLLWIVYYLDNGESYGYDRIRFSEVQGRREFERQVHRQIRNGWVSK